MNHVTNHARERAAERCKANEGDLRAMQRNARPVGNRELIALGVSPYEGSFYHMAVWRGQRWILVSGANCEIITIIKVGQ